MQHDFQKLQLVGGSVQDMYLCTRCNNKFGAPNGLKALKKKYKRDKCKGGTK